MGGAAAFRRLARHPAIHASWRAIMLSMMVDVHAAERGVGKLLGSTTASMNGRVEARQQVKEGTMRNHLG